MSENAPIGCVRRYGSNGPRETDVWWNSLKFKDPDRHKKPNLCGHERDCAGAGRPL
jgi:hypothetical protein